MYKTIPINNDEIWQPTYDAWIDEAEGLGEEGVFIAHEVASRLTSLREQDQTEDNIHGYFIVKQGDKIASSLLETSHAMPNSEKPWLKLLNVTLRPSLLPSYNGDGDLDVMRETFQVSATSIMHAIRLIFNDLPATELKIYGRTVEMQTLFKHIVTAGTLDDVLETIGLTARLEHRWLVLAKN